MANHEHTMTVHSLYVTTTMDFFIQRIFWLLLCGSFCVAAGTATTVAGFRYTNDHAMPPTSASAKAHPIAHTSWLTFVGPIMMAIGALLFIAACVSALEERQRTVAVKQHKSNFSHHSKKHCSILQAPV
ncbi:hypothetical protein M514_04835 [Trichuris suis]|uniref:Uncharacterized protein n=1 Tax=Trichuris suis TaxID=68888 RepID=A0A085MAP7_9BILA|nr:hypothetical protein M513_04835 [Trichuris suis]KFD73152.1 hypothetical protein M514_04835 [Trichuris suis]KHJ45604.1 hypothetical protein D918_04341 [Trichuris suis]